MKNKILVLLLSLVAFNLNAQYDIPDPGDAEKIKRSTIVVTSEIDSSDVDLQALVEKYWTFNSNFKFLPKEEAFKYWKKNNKTCVLLSLGLKQMGYYTRSSSTMGSGFDRGYVPTNMATRLVIYFRKNKLKSAGYNEGASVFLEGSSKEADIVFGIKVMNYLLDYSLSSTKMEKRISQRKIKYDNLPLRGIKVLVNDYQASLVKRVFPTIKSEDIEVVPTETINAAIFNETKGIAYVKSLKTSTTFLYYIVGAEDGKIYSRKKL